MGSSGILAATAAKSSGGSLFPLIAIVALIGLMYFVMIRPQRNRQRRVQQTQSEITPGQQVRTTAGIYGTLTSVNGDDVMLEISPGVEIRILRRAIMEVLSGADGATAGGVPADGAAAHQEEPADSTGSSPSGTVSDGGSAANGSGAQPGARNASDVTDVNHADTSGDASTARPTPAE
jgi:preprotein translocase subunit YajC